MSSRRVYVALAQTLGRTRPKVDDVVKRSQWRKDCEAVAGAMLADNQRFDRQEFLHSCETYYLVAQDEA